MILLIFRSLYPYFFPLTICGIIFRIHEKKWCKAETVLLLIYAVHNLLVLFQIWFSGGAYSRRYFLTAVPLLFGWTGYALHKLVSYRLFRWLLPAGLLFLLFDAMRPALEYLWKPQKQEEYFVIRTLAPVIRRDWGKTDSFYVPVSGENEYFPPNRPLVQCDRFRLLGYASGGSCLIPDRGMPMPDYRVFENTPVVPPYTEIFQTVYRDKTYRLGRRVK